MYYVMFTMTIPLTQPRIVQHLASIARYTPGYILKPHSKAVFLTGAEGYETKPGFPTLDQCQATNPGIPMFSRWF